MVAQFSKPLYLEAAHFDNFVGGVDPAAQQHLATQTAWALLNRVRKAADPELVARVIEHAATHGVEEIAELWADARADTLAGVLWRLYLIRRAAQLLPQEIAAMFRAGQSEHSVESVVAAVAEPTTAEAVVAFCDSVLRGVFKGDFAAALERAWAYCRVLAVGAAVLADSRELDSAVHAQQLTMRGARYLEIGEELLRAAKLWRFNRLD